MLLLQKIIHGASFHGMKKKKARICGSVFTCLFRCLALFGASHDEVVILLCCEPLDASNALARTDARTHVQEYHFGISSDQADGKARERAAHEGLHDDGRAIVMGVWVKRGHRRTLDRGM